MSLNLTPNQMKPWPPLSHSPFVSRFLFFLSFGLSSISVAFRFFFWQSQIDIHKDGTFSTACSGACSFLFFDLAFFDF
jgi:putative flippase GtrA